MTVVTWLLPLPNASRSYFHEGIEETLRQALIYVQFSWSNLCELEWRMCRTSWSCSGSRSGSLSGRKYCLTCRPTLLRTCARPVISCERSSISIQGPSGSRQPGSLSTPLSYLNFSMAHLSRRCCVLKEESLPSSCQVQFLECQNPSPAPCPAE